MNAAAILERGLRRALKMVGLRIQKYQTPSLTWEIFFEALKERGFIPDTIIDVGVAWGTSDLYDAFPSASYILVEPLREFRQALQALSKKLEARVINAAAGTAPGKIAMHVEALPSNSSTFAGLVGNKVASYDVEVVRLDQVIELGRGTTLLKVDVQGAELQVVEGCTGILDRIDMAILEASLITQQEGVPEFGDVIAYMNGKGFVLYGIIGGVNRPLDHASAQVDLVFVPKNHPCLSG
jgi:FkbM family methyltransferase